MGWTSEMVAETYKVSRQKQDEYALISHTRANEVIPSLHFYLPSHLSHVSLVYSQRYFQRRNHSDIYQRQHLLHRRHSPSWSYHGVFVRPQICLPLTGVRPRRLRVTPAVLGMAPLCAF